MVEVAVLDVLATPAGDVLLNKEKGETARRTAKNYRRRRRAERELE